MSDVKKYDCTNGRAQFCYGCYQMTESEYGDYVEVADYDALLAERDQLRAELDAIRGQEPVAFAVFADNGNIRIWSANSAATRAELVAQGMEISDLYALPPQQPDAVSVPRELVQEALEMAIDDAGEHQCSPCFNPTRQRVLDAQVERWRALLSTRQAEEGE